MRHGYTAKVSYKEISTKVFPYITNNSKFYEKDACRDVFISMGCSSNSFKLGRTHIFFRSNYGQVIEKYHDLTMDETKKIGEDVSAKFKLRQRNALCTSLRFIAKSKILDSFALFYFF